MLCNSRWAALRQFSAMLYITCAASQQCALTCTATAAGRRCGKSSALCCLVCYGSAVRSASRWSCGKNAYRTCAALVCAAVVCDESAMRSDSMTADRRGRLLLNTRTCRAHTRTKYADTQYVVGYLLARRVKFGAFVEYLEREHGRRPVAGWHIHLFAHAPLSVCCALCGFRSRASAAHCHCGMHIMQTMPRCYPQFEKQ
jgi:hypothetical protein